MQYLYRDRIYQACFQYIALKPDFLAYSQIESSYIQMGMMVTLIAKFFPGEYCLHQWQHIKQKETSKFKAGRVRYRV